MQKDFYTGEKFQILKDFRIKNNPDGISLQKDFVDQRKINQVLEEIDKIDIQFENIIEVNEKPEEKNKTAQEIYNILNSDEPNKMGVLEKMIKQLKPYEIPVAQNAAEALFNQ